MKVANHALQLVGLLALIVWTVGGVVAWSKVKEGVQLTVQESDGGGEDSAALLADRLDVLSADLDALVESLGENFGVLAEALEREAAEVDVESARVRERLTRLEAALPDALAARESSGALKETLARLETIVAAAEMRGVAPVAAAAGEPMAVAAAEPVEVTEAEPVAETDGPESAVAADGAAEGNGDDAKGADAEPAPKSSFLAFRLPSRDFRFEGRQTFELLGDLSRVGFDAKSTLHDFTGVSNAVEGSVSVDLARPGEGIDGAIEIRTASLGTDLEGRDEAMLEHLDAERHETLRFVPEAFEADTVDADAKRVAGTCRGKLMIRGVTKDVRMPVTAHVDESRRLVIEGEMPLRLPDYDVPVPNKLGVISMNEEVRVWIHLRARPRPGEGAH